MIITKTEVAPDVPVVAAESYAQAYDFDGRLIGTIRIPIEEMIYIPDQMVRVDQGSIYLLAAEKSSAEIYKVIKTKMSNHQFNSIPYEQESNALPLDDTGPNGYLHRVTASNRADEMINLRWTIKDGNINVQSNTRLPPYLKNKAIGDQVTSIPL